MSDSESTSSDDSASSASSAEVSAPALPSAAVQDPDSEYIVPPDEVPTYSTGKVPEFLGAKGPFAPKQKAVILAVYAPKYLEMRSRKPRPRKRARSKWLKKAVAEILEGPLFQNLDPALTKKQWDSVSQVFI